MISFTIRQPIRFGGQPGAHPVASANEKFANGAKIEDDKAVQAAEHFVGSDALVLSEPKQITLQFPEHDMQRGKDTHVLNALLQRLLTAVAISDPGLLKGLAHHSGYQDSASHRSRLTELENDAKQDPSLEVNFLEGGKEGPFKQIRSKNGQLTVIINNNPSNVQHSTQNNGQAGSLLNTLANVTPWGMAKVLGGTGIAVLGTYYLGPTVLNYAKNKLVGLVLPENLMGRATEFVRTPLSWFGNGTTASTAATAAAATVAETATETIAATAAETATNVAVPTITQVATETLANNGTTKVLPTILQGDVPLSTVTGSVMDSISDGLGNAASVLGNVAARGLNLGFSFLNSPASMFVFPFFYNYARSRGLKGHAQDIHYHVAPPMRVYQETGRATGQVKGFKGNVHGFRSS